MRTIPEQPMFPNFSSWRSYQQKAVDFIVNTSKDFISINAPTGSGKSLIAIASASLLQGQTYYIVGTKNLQDQLLGDFPNLITIKGRNNFKCLMKDDVTCEQCMYQYVKEDCPKKIQCLYYAQKEKAKIAKIVIWNYSMFLTNQYFAKDFPEVELLVCDEAHLLEGELMNFVDITFNYRFFNDIDLPFPKREDPAYIFTMLNQSLKIIKKKYNAARDIIREKINEDSGPSMDDIQLCNKWEGQLKKIRFFAKVYAPDNWVLDYFKDSKKWKSYISFKPIKINMFSDYLFNWADKIVLMSATMPYSSILCNSLGIPQKDIDQLIIPSTFRKENRPIIYIPIGLMNYKHREDTLKNIIPFLIKYCKYYKEKILIHCVNYEIANMVQDAFQSFDGYRIFYHKNAKERIEALDKFKSAKPPALIISPSMETGVDLIGDICRVQFILKIPYLPLGDKQVKKRMDIDYFWYVNNAIARLVQSYGRIVRSKDDWGITYILDSCFDDLLKKHRSFFPPWFLESVYQLSCNNCSPEDWFDLLYEYKKNLKKKIDC